MTDTAQRVTVALTGRGLVTAYGLGVDAYVRGTTTAGGSGTAPGPVVNGTDPIDPARIGATSDEWLGLAVDEALRESGWGPHDGVPELILVGQSEQPQDDPRTTPLYTPRTVRSSQLEWEAPLVLSHACASVLFAVDLAVRLLADGEAPAVLVAGVSTCNVYSTQSLEVVRAVGSHPPRPFDQRRDGITIGEGAGALLLERRDDAEARGRTADIEVAAVVAGIEGRSAAASDDDVVRRCMTEAMSLAAVDRLDYVHAHATGTPQGDEAEARAVSALVARLGSPPVPVSSHKGALGHLLHTSGFPGIVSATVALQTGVLPATANLERPLDIPHVLFPTTPYQPEGGVRTAMVNAFGFGGNNASVVLRDVGPCDQR
ncbi:3-oxoacyl-ACP synthase [Cellulomonas sp. APG4]|uniref:beta-ketoacyl synthase N-terminal-like domain-containing protein n=1 Tax=Cellulomonas sp. APG4 TaxID=1538656 RepID=UPI0013798EDD|nr:beta-ketoacyl synthase N-terminal-like domain-containing protein [Cellulomonas sp. APG4]NCT91694.1 3-oxoacyl-ACP synthase [Cellulomonas sp. APG4]